MNKPGSTTTSSLWSQLPLERLLERPLEQPLELPVERRSWRGVRLPWHDGTAAQEMRQASQGPLSGYRVTGDSICLPDAVVVHVAPLQTASIQVKKASSKWMLALAVVLGVIGVAVLTLVVYSKGKETIASEPEVMGRSRAESVRAQFNRPLADDVIFLLDVRIAFAKTLHMDMNQVSVKLLDSSSMDITLQSLEDSTAQNDATTVLFSNLAMADPSPFLRLGIVSLHHPLLPGHTMELARSTTAPSSS